MTARRHKFFIIDGMAIAYRAHFALIRDPLVTSDGRHISATFGFLNALFKILRDEDPEYLAVAFDSREKTFRHEKFPEYKATREKMPFEMRPQIPWIKDILNAMRIPIIEVPGYEADDIIGTMARQAEKKRVDAFMVSGDKDFMQLIGEHVFLYAPASGKRPLKVYDREAVRERWGVSPENIIDLLGLMGDSSDNIPGIRGVGEKTAVKLLEKYGSLEAVISHADEIRNARVRENLEEQKELAFLSRELVTIDTEVPLDISWDSMQVNQNYNEEKLLDTLQELELHKFIRELKLKDAKGNDEPDPEYRLYEAEKDIRGLVKRLRKEKVVAVDTETDGLDPLTAPLVGVSLACRPWEGCYIPYTPERLQLLKPLLEDAKVTKAGQHIKFDILVLRRHGAELQGELFDTMLAAYLLNPDVNSYKLELLAERYLHYQMMPITELIGEKKRDQIPMSEVSKEKVCRYAAEDADITFQLYKVFQKKLGEDSLLDVFEKIETPLVRVLADMQEAGVFVDIPFLKQMSGELGREMTAIMEGIYDLAGGKFNINSPKQLSHILFEKLGLPAVKKTKTGYSTDVNVLEKLKHEHDLPQKILDFRMIAKLRSTYVDALPELVNAETGRIHGSFNQTVAATGRLSSSNPNFQNIPVRTPEGRKIRRAFRAQEKGWKIMAADYSQVELRIMAHLSEDENLVRAFRQDADIHTRTAATVFNVKDADVSADMRRTAKVINFGIMYGAGSHRISQELNIPYGDASAIIQAYFERYTGVKKYIEKTISQCSEKGYVETLYGRLRRISDINSENHNLREAAKRAAINMPVQGTAADIIKIAMIRIHKEMQKEKMRSRLILQVHDELVFELAPGEGKKMRAMVASLMEGAADLRVPLRADIGTGKSWYEAH